MQENVAERQDAYFSYFARSHRSLVQSWAFWKFAATRDWTRDLQIFSLTLSQLSYRGDAIWALWFCVGVQEKSSFAKRPRSALLRVCRAFKVGRGSREELTSTFIANSWFLKSSPPSRIWTSDLEISDFSSDLQSPALPTELSVVAT